VAEVNDFDRMNRMAGMIYFPGHPVHPVKLVLV
jgi:hypothetical protein